MSSRRNKLSQPKWVDYHDALATGYEITLTRTLTRTPDLKLLRTLPIRIKLTIMSVLVVVSLSSILGLSWYRDRSLRQMNDTHAAIIAMDMMLLKLEHSENNFVNLFDNRHRDEFSETFETFVESIEDLKVQFWAYDMPVDTLEKLIFLTSEYQYTFEVMAEELTKIGHAPQAGLRKTMSETISHILNIINATPTDQTTRLDLHRYILHMDISAKDFLLYKDKTYAENFQHHFNAFTNIALNAIDATPQRDELISAGESYHRIFFDLVQTAETIGLTFNEGLRGEIARTVAMSQQRLNKMTREVNATIEQKKQALNVLMGTLVAVFTLAILFSLMLMGRSISVPIRNVTNIMTRLADGNLSVDIPNTPRRDEIGDMLRALRIFKMGAIIRRSTQQELRIAHDELEKRVAERTRELSEEVEERRRTETALKNAREQAESANHAKSMFLANMSHELRTPLNAIIGYSEMLQEDAKDMGYTDLAPDLERICNAGKHLLAIINEILDLSKIEAGRIDISIDTFQVRDVIDTVSSTVQPLINANNNTLEIACNADVGEMESDEVRLRQILFNFLSNAAKFTENGTITLRVLREPDVEGDTMVFSVSDTGIGMSRDQLNTVFEAFTQADTSTTRKYGGTGLGLTVNREFARLMGGEVIAKSTPDVGTTFTVRLPASLDRDSSHSPPDDTI